MSSDKTYLVIQRSDDYTKDVDYVMFYEDDRSKLTLYPQQRWSHVAGKNDFPYFRNHLNGYVLELPASVKTNNDNELTFIHIEPTHNAVSRISKQQAIDITKTMRQHFTLYVTDNKTNGKLWISSLAAIVALPITTKDISHQIISDLI